VTRACGGVTLGLAWYYLTSLIVLAGASIGVGLLRPQFPGSQEPSGLVESLTQHAGARHHEIATKGYSYDPQSQSSIASFPAYPLAARAVAWATGLSPDLSLLIVAHLALAAAFPLLAWYASLRAPPDAPPEQVDYTLLAAGLFPPAFIWRCAYTESLLLLLAVLAMLGLARRWPLWNCALVVGLATGTRPVGVALLAPLAIATWQSGGGRLARTAKLAALLPLGCWGLLAFMLWQ
jgi:hypothetical protein